MKRTCQAAGFAELAVLGGSDFQSVGHIGIVVGRVGQAARLAQIELPGGARRGPEVERRERVELAGAGNGGDRAQDALRLVDARAVVGLDSLQVLLDHAHRGDSLALDGLLDVGDCRLVNFKGCGAPL